MNPSRNNDTNAVNERRTRQPFVRTESVRTNAADDSLENCIGAITQLEAVRSFSGARAGRVARFAAGEQLLIRNRPLERSALDQITPAARIDVPLGVTDHVRLEALLPLHCLEERSARRRVVIGWLRYTRYAASSARHLIGNDRSQRNCRQIRPGSRLVDQRNCRRRVAVSQIAFGGEHIVLRLGEEHVGAIATVGADGPAALVIVEPGAPWVSCGVLSRRTIAEVHDAASRCAGATVPTRIRIQSR